MTKVNDDFATAQLGKCPTCGGRVQAHTTIDSTDAIYRCTAPNCSFEISAQAVRRVNEVDRAHAVKEGVAARAELVPPPLNPVVLEQTPPTPREGAVPVWDMVMADMRARDAVGRARYTTPLQANNGRDPLVDLYQELLDATVYCRQAIEERNPGAVVPALPHRAALHTEVRRLQNRVDELLEGNTELVEQRRRFDRTAAVRRFFDMAGQDAPHTPQVPSEEVVRFRLRVVAEEFLELLEATLSTRAPGDPSADLDFGNLFRELRAALHHVIDAAPVVVDFPLMVDACIDLAYVVEGMLVASGVDAAEVWDAVHAANLQKAGGPRRESDGKLMKPEGWKAPDVAGILRRKGWVVRP